MQDSAYPAPLEADLVAPDALTDADIAAWRALQAAEPAFASPLLGVDFARAVGAVRDDARVAVFRRGGRTIGFLAHHRRPGGFARPIGAPFCDYHALVASRDAALGPGEALQAAGLGALRLSGLVDPFEAFGETVTTRTAGHRIVLETTSEAYLEALWRGSGNRRKNYRRYRRSLEKAVGRVRLVGDDRDPASFERLIAWKRDQFARTGLHDFLAVPWAAALMRGLFDHRTEAFGGQMLSLYAGDQLVAAHFGARQGGWFHPWISAFDPDLRAHSPGTVHQVEAIAAMSGLGLSTYDLGPGEDHWKTQFTNAGASVGAGLAAAPNFAGALARSSDRFWALPPLRGARLVGRVRNRLDQIAALELTLSGRMQGAAYALATQRRRQWAA
ncbi:MAG TPA: GNAT family N-acetyltransferase [Caulobacteraceae bacterium]|nr:GNAT family N-acetyltransferase [Caulobacteraceae bacterium]